MPHFRTGLMNAVAGALLNRGHRAASLWVLDKNRVARRVYESLGGTPIAEKRASVVEVAYGWPDLRRLISSRAE